MSYEFDWSVLWTYRASLLEGAGLTLLLSLAGLGGAIVLGILAGTGSLSRRAGVRGAAIFYVEGARNVPLLVHIYVWYLGFSSLRLPAFWCASFALAIYSGAYVAEIVRSGVQSVPKGQMAAGLA